MDKSIMKIVITVMIVYIMLMVGSVCLLMHSGKLAIESVGKSNQINQYKENGDRSGKGNSFSLNPMDQN